MSDNTSKSVAIATVPELLAHALAMETEAAERYGELADQMETHRKSKVAAIFRRLEKAEQKHLDELTTMCSGMSLPHYAPWDFKWAGAESPEAIDTGKMSYHLTVQGAVLLALEHERQALAFYAGVAETASDAEVCRLARDFAAEEMLHVGWLEAWLADCGPADALALEDPDPPMSQE
jgi:rubrerythrin